MRKHSFYFGLICLMTVFACQNNHQEATHDNTDSSANNIETTALKQQEPMAEGQKKMTARLTFGEVHPTQGYALEFTDKSGKSFMFRPGNKAYDGLGYELIDFNSRGLSGAYANYDFDIVYTEGEGENPNTGDKEVQYSLISLSLAKTKWNETLIKLIGLWYLNTYEKDNKTMSDIKASMTLFDDGRLIQLDCMECDERSGNWKISDDMKFLIFIENNNEQKMKIIEISNSFLTIMGPNGKLVFEKQEQNGD